MDKGKYIIIEYMGHEIPILFSNLLNHADIGQGMKVVAAGVFEVDVSPAKNIRVTAWGKSIALKVESRRYDEDIIETLLRGR